LRIFSPFFLTLEAHSVRKVLAPPPPQRTWCGRGTRVEQTTGVPPFLIPTPRARPWRRCFAQLFLALSTPNHALLLPFFVCWHGLWRPLLFAWALPVWLPSRCGGSGVRRGSFSAEGGNHVPTRVPPSVLPLHLDHALSLVFPLQLRQPHALLVAPRPSFSPPPFY